MTNNKITLEAPTVDEAFGEPSTIPWVVQPLLKRNSALMLYGRPGLGKTTLAMQLARAVAGSEPEWLGFPVLAHGPVVWLQLDMPDQELEALVQRTLGEAPEARQNMRLLRFRDQSGEPLWNIDVLRAGQEVSLLREKLRELRPTLFVVDTISDVYRFDQRGDQNQQARQVVQELRNVAPSAAIVYLQHQRKRLQSAVGDDQDSYLGGMAWAGTATSVLQLNRHSRTIGEGDEESVEVSHHLAIRKMRLGNPPGDKLILEQQANGEFKARWTAPGALRMANTLFPGATREVAMTRLSGHFGISREALKKAWQRMPEGERPAWRDNP